jgi:TolA-binding protein
MYLVNKGFANSKISASKGKVIDIKDKSLATALEKAGFITFYSEKAMSNKEMEKTINDLTKQLNDKDSEIQTLSDRIVELEEELKLKENADEDKDNLDNVEESKEDGKDSEPSDENKVGGSNPDDKSSKEPKTDKE